ncbi:MAG: ATP-binding protein [Planctomycetes bacterium]|nr:ATP-binding protein [Planctomycetota bacterium]
MANTDLLEVARTWSHWDSPPNPSTPRSVELPSSLSPGIALVVQGVRRCGKSTLLAQLMARYSLDPEACLFINFEDPRLAGVLEHSTLQELVDGFEEKIGGGGTYFLDEIQVVDGWESWLRMQLDRGHDRRFVVTGSNARLLSGELGSKLTGRHLRVELFPFDLAEYRELIPNASVETYLESGGFPAPIQSSDRDLLLRAYFGDIVERDMRERVGARSTRPLRQLVQMVFESAGSELSARRIAAAIGVSTDTAGLYLDAAESAYLLFPCPYFAWSERKRLARNKKFYPIDTGLRRVSVTRTGNDLGKALECATFLELRRRFDQVYYWKGRGEVDFVVEQNGAPIPIQVTWNGPTERHRAAIDEFQEEHPQAREAVFVTPEDFDLGMPELHAN